MHVEQVEAVGQCVTEIWFHGWCKGGLGYTNDAVDLYEGSKRMTL